MTKTRQSGWIQPEPADWEAVTRLLVSHELTCIPVIDRLWSTEGRKVSLERGEIRSPELNGWYRECMVHANDKGELTALVHCAPSGLLIAAGQAPGLRGKDIESKDTQWHRRLLGTGFSTLLRNATCRIGAEDLLESLEPFAAASRKSAIRYTLMSLEFPRAKPGENLAPPARTELPAGVALRRASLDDMRALETIQFLYDREEVIPPGYDFREEYSRKTLSRLLRDQIVYVAEAEGRPIAKVSTNGWGVHFLQIGGVYTTQEWRRRGIAKALVQRLLEDIRTMDFSASLFVKSSNTHALELYRSLGFKEDSPMTIYYH